LCIHVWYNIFLKINGGNTLPQILNYNLLLSLETSISITQATFHQVRALDVGRNFSSKRFMEGSTKFL